MTQYIKRPPPLYLPEDQTPPRQRLKAWSVLALLALVYGIGVTALIYAAVRLFS
jgi:hypothetical protein